MKILRSIVCVCVLFFAAFAYADEVPKKSIYIEVYYDTFTMSVWEVRTGNDLSLIGVYPVTLTWKNFRLPKRAKITDIIINPIWYPTNGVRTRYLKKHGIYLKDAYGPSEARNAMGAFKWKLEFASGNGFYTGDNDTRVHEEKAPEKIGTKDSSGCVRLLKEDGLYLSHLLRQYEQRVMVYTTFDKALRYYAAD